MTTEKTDHLEATTLPCHRLPFQIPHCQWFRLGRISAVRACRWVGGGGSWFGFDPCGPSRPARGGGFLWRSPSLTESHPDKETSDTWHTFQSFFFKWFKTVSVSFSDVWSAQSSLALRIHLIQLGLRNRLSTGGIETRFSLSRFVPWREGEWTPSVWGLISGPGHTVEIAITAPPQRAILPSNKGTFTWTLCVPALAGPWRADTDTGPVPQRSTPR